MRLWIAFGAFIAFTIGAAPVEGAGFTIEEWSLRVSIVGPYPDVVGDSITEVTSPFLTSHSVTLEPSLASASYNLAWSDTFGRFLIEGSHQAEDMRFSSTTSGLMYFETTVDVLFDIDIAYTYDLPGGQMSGGFTYNLLDPETHENFAGGSHHDDTWTAGPVSGTLTAQASGILPAGREYAFTYKMELDTSSFTGLLATGSGHVDLTLTAVPEPASLAPLAILALIARRRRSGWRCAVR